MIKKIKVREIKKKIIVREIKNNPLPKTSATTALSRQRILDSIHSDDNSKSLPAQIKESPLEEVAQEAVITSPIKRETEEEKREVKYHDNSKSTFQKHYSEQRKYQEAESYNSFQDKNPEEETTSLHSHHRDNPFASQIEKDQNAHYNSQQEDHFKKRKSNF
ncbi:MAG: hypothetical protein AABX11_05225 [Nanoarchaeota archaeon]